MWLRALFGADPAVGEKWKRMGDEWDSAYVIIEDVRGGHVRYRWCFPEYAESGTSTLYTEKTTLFKALYRRLEGDGKDVA